MLKKIEKLIHGLLKIIISGWVYDLIKENAINEDVICMILLVISLLFQVTYPEEESQLLVASSVPPCWGNLTIELMNESPKVT